MNCAILPIQSFSATQKPGICAAWQQSDRHSTSE